MVVGRSPNRALGSARSRIRHMRKSRLPPSANSRRSVSGERVRTRARHTIPYKAYAAREMPQNQASRWRAGKKSRLNETISSMTQQNGRTSNAVLPQRPAAESANNARGYTQLHWETVARKRRISASAPVSRWFMVRSGSNAVLAQRASAPGAARTSALWSPARLVRGSSVRTVNQR